MASHFKQAPQTLLMIRPSSFGFNAETSSSNHFQQQESDMSSIDVAIKARVEFEKMVTILRNHNVTIEVFDDTKIPVKPDAVFPNNWISFHEDGKVILYPMLAENRRTERRREILDDLKKHYEMREVIDLSSHERNGQYLEGTGSVVFDHVNSIAYACRSARTNENLFLDLCQQLQYEPVLFNALDRNGYPIYHTNVMLAIGSKFIIVCLDAIRGEDDQEVLLKNFSRTGHKVIAISYHQMESFAGNVFEVEIRNGDKGVIMSRKAFQSLLPGQVDALSRFAEIIPIEVDTIEKYGGGSVRCMVAGIFLKKIGNV